VRTRMVRTTLEGLPAGGPYVTTADQRRAIVQLWLAGNPLKDIGKWTNCSLPACARAIHGLTRSLRAQRPSPKAG
jgi:hypothetical protein